MTTLASRYRTAFVTGASAGLGEAFTEMLLREGVEVWGTARSTERLRRWCDQPRFHPLALDLQDSGQTEHVFRVAQQQSGGIELLINNAGYGVFGPLAETDFATYVQQLRVMLEQPLRLAQLALPQLRQRNRGGIVNVASLAVEFPLPYMSGYNAAKAALAAFTESLLMETAGTRIAVVDFRPGDYRTGFNDAMKVRSGGSEAAAPSPPGAPRVAAIWRILEQNLQAAPPVERAAADLRRALGRGYRGTYRSGSFFQARLAPAVMSLLPQRIRRALHWRYFHVR